MAIDKISSSFMKPAPIKTYEQVQQGQQTTGGTANSTSFSELFGEAIQDVNSLQADADTKIEGMMTGKGVSTHSAMIALEKADIAFQLMNQIRGKIVRAYEEVMRTQV